MEYSSTQLRLYLLKNSQDINMNGIRRKLMFIKEEHSKVIKGDLRSKRLPCFYGIILLS